MSLFSFFQHKDAYQVILDGVKGGPKEKRLAAQFIPKFFSSFPELADAAINAQLDLCEDEDVSVSTSSRQGFACCGWLYQKTYLYIVVSSFLNIDPKAGYQRAPTFRIRRQFAQSRRHPHTAVADR